MSDNEEVHVPSTEYTNLQRIVHNTDDNYLLVKTREMGRTENANAHLLPDESEEENFSFEGSIEGYVGGVERLKLSAFSEDIAEVLAFIEEVETNGHGYMSVDISSSSNVSPVLRFREKHGDLQAVITHRDRL